MKTKMLSLLAAAALLSSLSAAHAASAELSMMEKYEHLKQAHIFQGSADGEAELERTLTRAELAVVLSRLLKLEPQEDAQAQFVDLEGHWVSKTTAVQNMVAYKIMTGKGNHRFDPNGLVTFEELAVVLTRAIALELRQTTMTDAIVSDWARVYVGTAVDAGVIDPQEDYTAPVTRADLVDAIFIEIQTTGSHSGGISRA